MVGAIGGVILASGVVGTVISFYLQGRSWEYQTRSAKIEKDSAAVLAALEGVDKLIDEKWLSTYELNDAIKTKLEGEKLDAAVKRFYAANKDWELRHNILASNLRIAVDSQFGVDDRNLNVGAHRLPDLYIESATTEWVRSAAGRGLVGNRLQLP